MGGVTWISSKAPLPLPLITDMNSPPPTSNMVTPCMLLQFHDGVHLQQWIQSNSLLRSLPTEFWRKQTSIQKVPGLKRLTSDPIKKKKLIFSCQQTHPPFVRGTAAPVYLMKVDVRPEGSTTKGQRPSFLTGDIFNTSRMYTLGWRNLLTSSALSPPISFNSTSWRCKIEKLLKRCWPGQLMFQENVWENIIFFFHHKPFRREIEHSCRMVLTDTTWQLRRFQTISRYTRSSNWGDWNCSWGADCNCLYWNDAIETWTRWLWDYAVKILPVVFSAGLISQWKWWQKKRKRKFFDLSTSHTTFLFTKILWDDCLVQIQW